MNYSNYQRGKRLCSALAIAACLGAINVQLASAQEDNRQINATNARVLDEIIVTAEKREQNLQEVPVAITAFTDDMLKARGIDAPQDLQQVVPSLVIGEQFQGPAKVTIRGIGSENIFPGGDPGVPVHINGHYTQSTAYVLRDMLDVERVEVLRGPQGTLYGRNAVGGNINIITKRPTDTFEGLVSGTVGSYGKRNLQAVLSGPIIGSLRGRLAISDDKRDGYVENVGLSGDDRDTSDYTSVRGSLLLDPTDNIELYLNAHYFDDKGNPGTRLFSEYPTGPGFTPGPPFFGGPNWWQQGNAVNPTLSDPFKISNNTPSKQKNKSEGVSLDFNWDLGAVEFRSLSAYDKSSWEVIVDFDGSSAVNRDMHFVMPFETFTQEFQLLSADTNDLNWVLGLFYYDEESSYTFQQRREPNNSTSQADPRQLLTGDISADSTSLGIYGQLDFPLTDRLEAVAGLRYSKDKKEAEQSGFSIGVEGQLIPPPFPSTVIPAREETWSEMTGKLGLNYQVREDIMLYASYSRGYKAGGFNLTQENPYDPERVDAWEAGLKSQWLDNRIQMNLAAFYYEYADKQDFQRFINPTNGFTVFHIVNAAAATNNGIELEAQAYLTDAFFVDLSVSYLNAEFDDFESIDSVRGNQNFILDGNKLPFSPDWTAHIGAQHDWELQANLGTLSIRGDYTWIDEQYSNAFNRDESSGLAGKADFVPAYHLVNARLKWESVDANWLAELYVRNLTDEVILSNPFVDTAQTTWGTYLAPRTYGLKLQFNF